MNTPARIAMGKGWCPACEHRLDAHNESTGCGVCQWCPLAVATERTWVNVGHPRPDRQNRRAAEVKR